jgi:hypothetical protein
VAAHTVGTDHHDRADRILHRTVHILVGRRRAGTLDLLLELGFQQRPVAVKGGNLFVQRLFLRGQSLRFQVAPSALRSCAR